MNARRDQPCSPLSSQYLLCRFGHNYCGCRPGHHWSSGRAISKDDLAGATPIQLPTQTQRKDRRMEHPTLYRTMQIDGLSIFYREAGPKDAPTLLLLHGLPSSSRMFEPLFARLSDSFHLVAPDYPDFGHSDGPDPKKFAYTFDHIAEIMDHFTEALGLSH